MAIRAAEIVNRDFKYLVVWQKSMEFATKLYVVAKRFPADEKYMLRSQLLRAVTSISANIAEGNGFQEFPKKQLSVYAISYGSFQETRSWVDLAFRLNYIDDELFRELETEANEIGRLLFALMKKVRRELHESYRRE